MQRVDRRIAIAAAALVAFFISACSAPPAPQPSPGRGPINDSPSIAAIAPHAPPPQRAEIPPRAPSPRALWRSGNWRWDGRQYVWLPGQYIERPSPAANWRPGYWQEGPDGWIWVEGQWGT